MTYVHQCVPSLPKVTIRYNTDRVSQLVLDVWRHRDHEPYKLTLNGCDLIPWQLVVALFILITK